MKRTSLPIALPVARRLPRGRTLPIVVLLLVGPGAAANGQPQAPPPPAAGTAASKTAPPPGARTVSGPPIPWKDMNARDRGKYMKKVVTPKMKVVFQAYDAKEFKRFNCATCHGKDAEDRKFKMPSPDLHALPSTPEAFQAKLKTEPTWPRWTKFMFEQVQPQMADLLGVPSFDPKKPEPGAFSCDACHTLQKS